MNMIVAVDNNWAIGNHNELLVSIPADMKFFRQETDGKVVVMGRKTLESFPNGMPLVNRVNIVLTENPDYRVKGAKMVHSLTELQEELKQDYITLAKSKGTKPVIVVARHALKNAMLPIITYAGPLLATLVTGSFVVETMFTIPGIGSEFVKSVGNRDYTLIMALTILYGAFIIIANIVTDLISAAVDPRVRLK